MTASFSLNQIAWGRMIFFLLLLIVPNYLIMQVQLVGPVDDRIGIATAVDLVIILPLMLFFFGFKKRVSWLVLCAFVFWGLILANWIIPEEADAYISYFNHSVILLEAGLIAFECIVLIILLKRIPLLVHNYKQEKKEHYHFLLSFSGAIQQTFSFKNKKFNKFQFTLRILATDIAAIYYSLFCLRKKAPTPAGGHAFTFHKQAGYFGVFVMLVHAMLIEIIAVHVLVAQYSHTAAWIVTALDVYTLLFILADYQAIRLSPVVFNEKGMHIQKGIRQYGFIPWETVKGIRANTKAPQEISKDQESLELALHGLEKEPLPYVIELSVPVEIRKFFGRKHVIRSIYVKMDDQHKFNEAINQYRA